MKSNKNYKILAVLLPMQWAFYQIIAQFPNFIENYYSNGLYPVISSIFHFTLGWIPFSIGDVIYTILVLYIIRNIYQLIKVRKFNIKKTLIKTLAFISVIYFIFSFGWGLNYHRLPITERLNFSEDRYTETELIDFTKTLIQKLNTVHSEITLNDSLVPNNLLTKKEMHRVAFNAYDELELKMPVFSIQQKSVKKSLFSLPLTYMGFAGYLNPFTNEAQVNYLIPKNNYPATTCHEIAHQLGIASENEANFVGFLASINSKDKFLNYSGYLMALRYCLFDIYTMDEELFNEIKDELNVGILKDMQESQDFWTSYQNKSEKYFKIFYDSYLKANNQIDGIRSYSKMVILLVNYDKKHPFE